MAHGQLKINEMFYSVQGEGHYSGIFSFFIRLQGCGVGCPWCDTKYTWAEGGLWYGVDEIISAAHKAHHIVITGGEPTLWDLDPLLAGLQKTGHRIQLETSGQNALKGPYFVPHWITWSPKNNLAFACAKGLQSLVNEIKWVVDTELEFDKMLDVSTYYLTRAVGIDRVITLMPEGTPPSPENMAKAIEWLACIPTKYQSNFRLSDRMQCRAGVK